MEEIGLVTYEHMLKLFVNVVGNKVVIKRDGRIVSSNIINECNVSETIVDVAVIPSVEIKTETVMSPAIVLFSDKNTLIILEIITGKAFRLTPPIKIADIVSFMGKTLIVTDKGEYHKLTMIGDRRGIGLVAIKENGKEVYMDFCKRVEEMNLIDAYKMNKVYNVEEDKFKDRTEQ